MENISEILRNCPEGTRLYSPTFGYVTLDHTSLNYVCVNNAEGQTLTFMFDGRYTEDGECSLFPSKECQDWSRGKWVQHLVKPGTVVYFESTPEYLNVKSTDWEFYTAEGKKRIISLCDIGLCHLKFASKEQREQFFNELEHNGYHWNFEKNIVEKTPVTPRFLVGNVIELSTTEHTYRKLYEICELTEDGYKAKELCVLDYNTDVDILIPFASQVHYILISDRPLQFKVGDYIRPKKDWQVRSSNKYESTGPTKITGIEKSKYKTEEGKFIWISDQDMWELSPYNPRSDESLKDEISRFEKQIDSVNGEIGNLEEKRREYRSKISDIQKELRRRDADRWKEKMSQSKHNIVKYSEMPEDIKSDWYHIRETVKDGCHGDPYDGCRGCEKNCELKARELFMKKYNIIKII